MLPPTQHCIVPTEFSRFRVQSVVVNGRLVLLLLLNAARCLLTETLFHSLSWQLSARSNSSSTTSFSKKRDWKDAAKHVPRGTCWAHCRLLVSLTPDTFTLSALESFHSITFRSANVSWRSPTSGPLTPTSCCLKPVPPVSTRCSTATASSNLLYPPSSPFTDISPHLIGSRASPRGRLRVPLFAGSKELPADLWPPFHSASHRSFLFCSTDYIN